MRLNILFLFCIQWAIGLSQLDPKDFIRYTTNDGLTDNNVTCITQDNYGFLWVGTSHGLNRFDGSNVESFRHQNTDHSLLSDEIVQLDWADSNQLVVSTKFGVHIVNIKTLHERNIVIPAGPVGVAYKVNIIHDLYSDRRGHFYIITRSGLYHFNQNWELQFRYDDYLESTGEFSGGFGVFSAMLDDDHIVVFGQHDYFKYSTVDKTMHKISGDDLDFMIYSILNHLESRNFTPREINPGIFLLFINDSDSVAYVDQPGTRVMYSRLLFSPLKREITWRSKIFHDHDSTYWLTSQSSGIFKITINEATGAVHLDTTKLFSAYFCNTIFTDKDQRIWIGTNNGLFRQHQRLVDIEFGNLPDPVSANFTNPSLIQFSSDKDHLYATGTQSGGLYIFRKKDLLFEGISAFMFPEYSNKTIRTIIHWRADTMICGTHNGVFWFNTKSKTSGLISIPGWDLKRNWSSELFVDSHHRLWVLGNMGSVCYMCDNDLKNCLLVSTKNTLAHKLNEIYHIAEDMEGNIWLAGSGMARYNNKQNAIDLFSENFPSFMDDSEMLSAIACDKNGGIWFGNAKNGLVNFNPHTSDTIIYTEEEGLPDRFINAIATDSQYVWISCRSGIARIDIDHQKIMTVINKRDIHSNTISSNKIYFDGLDKVFYVAIGEGLIRFKPGDVKNEMPAPHLMIENVAFGYDSLLWNPPLHLYSDWTHRDLTITFGTINFHDADDQVFSYRMKENKDTSWIKLGRQHKLFFSSLDAGHHEAEIKVSSSNHRWPVQRLNFSIHIQPPFWKTWWFYILWGLFFVMGVYALFNYRLRQLKKVIRVRERISQDLHDEVGATLSGIAMYSYLTKEQLKTGQTTEMEKSLNVIQSSSTEMVTKLNDIIWAVDPQHDSLQKLVQRLEEYAVEMASTKGIRVDITIPKDLEKMKVPMKARRNVYLIFKEAINNAVKYSEATKIELGVRESDHSLEFVVKDNGVGFDVETVKRGNGLDNMQKRAEDIEGRLSLTSAPGQGSTISISVSLMD